MKAFSAILFHVASPDVEASDPKGHVHKNNQKHREKKKEEDDPRLGVKASKKHDKTGKYCRYTEIKQAAGCTTTHRNFSKNHFVTKYIMHCDVVMSMIFACHLKLNIPRKK